MVRLLELLGRSEHSLEALKLKLNLSSASLQALLEWGLANGLWVREPFTGLYRIADTGELLLNDPGKVDELLRLRPPELPGGDCDDAPQLLKDPQLLARIRTLMDREIVGEYENKLLLFLLLLSKDLGSRYAQACFIMGESSSGKSHLMHRVLSYFPEECVIWLTRTTAHGLEYYLSGRDLSGHVLAVEEAPGFSDAQQYVRPMFSERGLRIVSAQAVGGGRVVSQVIEVKGCPAFVTTSAVPVVDEQMSTRVWILSTDESREQTERILRFQALREKFPAGSKLDDEKAAVREALSQLRPVGVLIPYADAIAFPASRTRARRDFPKLLTLIKVSAYLHQYQRPRLVLDGEEFVVATFADYHIAYTLASRVLRPTILGLPEGVLKVYDVCKKLSSLSVEITSRSVTEECNYSQSTVRKYLNQLVKARLLLKDESQREHVYTVIEDREMGLSGIHKLEERFGEKELEKWIKRVQANEIRYEEVRGTVYNPLPESTTEKEDSNDLSDVEKIGESGFTQIHALTIDRVREVIESLEKERKDGIPFDELIKKLKDIGIKNAEEVVRHLLCAGEIYESIPGVLRRRVRWPR